MIRPGAGADLNDLADAKMRAIFERARASFADNIGAIDAAVAELEAGRLAEPLRCEAERAAHRLAGTAGTVGFPDATEVAHELETAFARGPHPSEANVLATQAAVLREILFGGGSRAATAEAPPLRVLALHTTQNLDAELHAAAASCGLGIARDGASVEIDAAIVDLAHPDGPALIRGYADRMPRVPVLALVDAASLDDRLVAARAGAALVLPRTAGVADIVAGVDLLADQHRHGQFRVLAVDDDPTILAILPAVLASEPVDVTTVDDARDFWNTLERTVPDLVMLDLDMPHVDGIELCRIIRTDPRWSSLPVLFLTAHADPATVDAIFAAGADDYISKPLVVAELCARVRNRLDRVALSRRLADTDPLTGLANRRRLETEFTRLCAFARRHDQPLSLALLDLDHLKRVNDTHGHAVGDIALRHLADRLTREFRGEDVVARWGGEEFVIVSVGLSRDAAARRLTNILEAFRSAPIQIPDRQHASLTVSFSAGVAELGPDGEDLSTLTRSADAALYRAKRAGRAQVLPAGQGRAPSPTPRRAAGTERRPLLHADILAYYATLAEDQRLATTGHGRLELARTQELLTRTLPTPPARVLDVGGGTGVYARWLAQAGYHVHLVDIVPEQVAQALGAAPAFTAAVGDARHLDEPDDSADAVLLLGPLYHLLEREDRMQALREARRVLRPGGVLAAAVVSRHSALLAFATRGELDPRRRDLALQTLAHGRHDAQLGFTTAYFHNAQDARAEVGQTGFHDVEVYAIEGPMWAAVKACHDPPRLDALIESAVVCARAVERDQALHAASAHLLVTGQV